VIDLVGSHVGARGLARLAGFASWVERVRGNGEDGLGEGMGWSEGDPFHYTKIIHFLQFFNFLHPFHYFLTYYTKIEWIW
jgi:hypothetical protein